MARTSKTRRHAKATASCCMGSGFSYLLIPAGLILYVFEAHTIGGGLMFCGVALTFFGVLFANLHCCCSLLKMTFKYGVLLLAYLASTISLYYFAGLVGSVVSFMGLMVLKNACFKGRIKKGALRRQVKLCRLGTPSVIASDPAPLASKPTNDSPRHFSKLCETKTKYTAKNIIELWHEQAIVAITTDTDEQRAKMYAISRCLPKWRLSEGDEDIWAAGFDALFSIMDSCPTNQRHFMVIGGKQLILDAFNSTDPIYARATRLQKVLLQTVEGRKLFENCPLL